MQMKGPGEQMSHESLNVFCEIEKCARLYSYINKYEVISVELTLSGRIEAQIEFFTTEVTTIQNCM